jgi:hypothetical protein
VRVLVAVRVGLRYGVADGNVGVSEAVDVRVVEGLLVVVAVLVSVRVTV